MRTIRFGTLSIAALALLAFVGGATAQTTSPTLLNSLEVQQLVTRATPADHARLGAHSALLAEQRAVDAKRHSAMAQAYAVSPSLRTPANSSATDHCKHLEKLNLQSAAALRELAAHHEGLAAGQASAIPRGTSGFESGAGAPAPTTEALSAMARQATTPADHRALQEYFLTAAKHYTSEASDHVAIAQSYRGTRIAQAADHCERIVANARESAKEATAAAAMHGQLANVAR